MRFIEVCAGLAVIAAVLSACGAAPPSGGGEPAPVPSRPLSVETVVPAADGRSVRVDFTGGQTFDPANPCSVAYEAMAEVVDGELEIGMYARPHPMPLAPGTACDAMGHARTLTIELDEPFTGTVVRDLAGYTILLQAPTGLAQIGALPEGWELRREGNVFGSATPRWEQVWSPDPDPWPAEGDSMVTLFQAFGGPVDATGGELGNPVMINGQDAALSLHPPTGSMVLVWSIGRDELALAGYRSDFSEAEFMALAESVTLPSD